MKIKKINKIKLNEKKIVIELKLRLKKKIY